MFKEPNIIRNRRNNLFITVKNSGKIMHKTLDLLLKYLGLWKKGKERKFIRKLSHEFNVDSRKVLKKYQKRLNYLSPEQMLNKIAKISLIYCDIIKEFILPIKDALLESLYTEVKTKCKKENFRKKSIICHYP